ncbi:MGH1-like glycoside hydrolase domain-containing protein [Microbacterium sp. ZW T5_45]|uniref:MGH1-like glycoside hydrolase domain-containing protein n=1 Tax=Microbacterium sp. ZW T5_45 TaxID=3378080 RepID=UPI003854C43F
MALPDDFVRIFSGRGAVAPRDHTVTGIRNLQMTPLEQAGWQFELSFREHSTGVRIHDRADLIWAHHRRTGVGMHPLALNFGSGLGAHDFLPPREDEPAPEGTLRGLVTQSCTWAPNEVERRGTFHKRILGRTLSFAVSSRTTTDAVADGVFLALTIRNREDQELRLTVSAHQRILPGAHADPRVDDIAERIDGRTIEGPVWQWPAGRTSEAARFRAAVSSDLPDDGEGWLLVVPARSEVSAVFRIAVTEASTAFAVPAEHPLTALLADSDAHFAAVHDRFLSRLPRVHGSAALAEFHLRCAHTLFEARWVRRDWTVTPFYSAGTWLATLAWDVSFSSALLALLEPDHLENGIRAIADAGLTQHSYLLWDGLQGPHYSYTLFAAIRAVRDLVDVAGRPEALDRPLLSGSAVGQELVTRMREVLERHRDNVGLISFGDEAHDYNENRTDGHQGAVAAINLVAIDALGWLADLDTTPDADRDLFRTEAAAIRTALDGLWDADAGWFRNRYADGATELYASFQMYDALRSTGLRPAERDDLLGHLRESAFLGPHGMYSVSREDEVHFDLDDADWGGGGQYTGMPLRIAQDLFAIGRADLGWDVLERCLTWSDAFPYFPQEVMTDSLTTPDVEQPVEVAAGAGVQAIVFGVFGLTPAADGSLRVAPAWDARSAGLSLDDYPHGDERVSVHLAEDGFEVRVGATTHRADYGETIEVVSPRIPRSVH